MKSLRFTALVLAALLTFSLPSGAKAEMAPGASAEVVKTFYAKLVETMKQGDKLGFEGRYKKLEPAVKTAFNLPLMSRFAVGPGWTQQDPANRQKFIESFSRFSIATYASRFTSFDGEIFEVLGEKPAAQGGIIVETHLTPKGGEPVTLNYLMRADETGSPRIDDVFLDATISELATRRSEFTAIIKRDGFPALIDMLDAKSKKMGS